MIKYIIGIIATLIFTGGVAFAQEAITFPIAELGNCTSKQACKTYCDDVNHIEACVSFGESHGLMRKDDANRARAALSQLKESIEEKVTSRTPSRPTVRTHDGPTDEEVEQLLKEKNGPGGCNSKEACQAYCETGSNMEECMDFALANGLMTTEQVEQAKKFMNKTGPGGCKGEACREYCEDESRAEECITFAEENGFISSEEAERTKKFVGKPGPGGCKGEACKAYCEDPSHMEECMSFAVENGFITKEEAERAKNFQKTLMNTTGPGGCEGEACKQYCDDPAHREACMQFAQKHGFAKPEMTGPPIEMGRDSVGTPPCSSPEECKKIYEERRVQEYPGNGDPRYMGNEQFREEGGMMAPPSAGEGYQMTPEERQKYEQYQRQPADGSSMQPPVPNEQYKAEYERQYQQEYNDQYNREYQQPPVGAPSDSYQRQMTPEQQQSPAGGEYTAPQQYEQQPAPAPTSRLSPATMGAAVWTAFRILFAF